MSEENVALVRELLEMFARRDHERAFDFYDPEIEWDTSRSAHLMSDIAGIYRGHDGVRAYWRGWLSAWRDLEFEVDDVRDAGDEVVALIGNQRQWGRRSGVAVEFPDYGIVFKIRDGKVVRVRGFGDQKSALEAAGLSE